MGLSRRTLVAGVVAGLVVGVADPAAASDPATARASVASDGTQANDTSHTTSISGDGRYVVFASAASNLVPGDTNNAEDVFVRDRWTDTTSRVSVASDGSQPNSSSERPGTSADGRYVVFASTASNLVPGDTNSRVDVFTRDRWTGTTSRVSVADGGAQANGDSFDPVISADGRYVAFDSAASNLAPGSTGYVTQVFVRDRLAGVTSEVSVATNGAEAGYYSYSPAISGDGRYVTFVSMGTNLPNGAANTAGTANAAGTMAPKSPPPPYVYVRDRWTGTTFLVSVNNEGSRTSSAGSPSISADGRYVAFVASSFLVPGNPNRVADIFVRDRWSATTSRVSVASDGTPANGYSYYPAVSADGRHVAFESAAANLVPGDTNNVTDIFVRNMVGG